MRHVATGKRGGTRASAVDGKQKRRKDGGSMTGKKEGKKKGTGLALRMVPEERRVAKKNILDLTVGMDPMTYAM
jgi:hypothetical protein